MKPWAKYTVIRLGIFAIALVGLSLLGIELWLAAIIAAVIGLCVAYIFFGKLRDAVARDLAERRSETPHDSDTDVEDASSDQGEDASR